MHNRFSLLVTDVMPIYMIIPRYSHNYAQFYQLLNNNLFTHRNTYALERSHWWNLWPSSLFSIILIFQHLAIFIAFYFNLHLYYKNTKKYYLIISIRSHFHKWTWRDWQPLYCVGCEDFICLCRCEGLVRGLLLDWSFLQWEKCLALGSILRCPFPVTAGATRHALYCCNRG